MVVMPNGCIAPRGGADVIAQANHGPKPLREVPCPALHRHEVPPARRREEPSHPSIDRGIGEEGSDLPCRQVPVPGNTDRLVDRSPPVPQPGQGTIRHHEVDRERLGLIDSATGQPTQRQVGHHGAPTSTIRALGLVGTGAHPVRVAREGGIRTDDLDHGTLHRQIGLSIRRRPHADPSSGRGPGVAGHHRRRVELCREPAAGTGDLSRGHGLEGDLAGLDQAVGGVRAGEALDWNGAGDQA